MVHEEVDRNIGNDSMENIFICQHRGSVDEWIFSQISVVDKDLTLVRESVHHVLYVTHTSQSRQSVPSLSEWVKLNLV